MLRTERLHIYSTPFQSVSGAGLDAGARTRSAHALRDCDLQKDLLVLRSAYGIALRLPALRRERAEAWESGKPHGETTQHYLG